jgi:4-diphosphocytidyl-2-C-methyl-D-erythritol kinase
MIVAIPDYAWSMPAVHTIHTFAKINLILKVAAPLTDGYHPICSWMHSIDLKDTISIEPMDQGASSFDIRWSDGSPVDWDIQSDLVYRAHKIFEKVVSQSIPVRVHVRKEIPAGGGLGGGSSNAAGMFMALNAITKAGLSQDQLRTVAHELGTDIPFFIDSESFEDHAPPPPAIVSGIGDRIDRTKRVDSAITLLIPSFGCPTGAVYRAFDELPSLNKLDLASVQSAAIGDGLESTELSNDLCDPAKSSVPQLAEVFDRLEALGVSPHLSGSGSTMFVVGRLTESIRASVESHIPDLKIIETRLV